MRKAIIFMFTAFLSAPALSQSTPLQDKAEIFVANNRNEPVTMTFHYAFRQYTWSIMQHQIESQDDVLYRFPSNIPGCQYLRDWQITDGILRIANAGGLLCEKRISLCDKRASAMTVGATSCGWKD
jgi:hypothetical protein